VGRALELEPYFGAVPTDHPAGDRLGVVAKPNLADLVGRAVEAGLL
jgi:hypothetical protein